MATTKATIAEQAMRILSGGHLKPDRNIDIREVMMYLDELRDEAAKLSFYSTLKNGMYEIDAEYLSYFPNVAVAHDNVKDVDYITLPASRISLPKDMGLYLITPMQNQAGAFIPIAQGQQWMYKNTATIKNETNTFYYPVGNIVNFINLDPAVSEVLVTMLASSKSLSQDATFPIPPDMEKAMVDALVERFAAQKQIPHDEVEDGIK